ncbi:glycosyl transferase [Klebsiella sp. K822]|uniref:glycosyl transferase n=1 Tax=unclassified Klebsiella TaxID=2608929 RepID=UPI003C2CF59E
MQKLTPDANKAKAILIRIVLLLTGSIAIIAGLCLSGGDMWMLTPRAEQYQPATGDLVDIVIYTPSKFFFALLYVLFLTLVWLLAVRNIPWRPIQHPLFPLMVLIAAGIFIFLHPEVTPGRDASIQYGKHNVYYTAIFWMKTNSNQRITQPSKYEIFVEAKDPRWPVDRDNLRRAWRCEVQRHSQFYTLSFNEGWFPNGDPQVMARQCNQVSDLNALSDTAIMIARPIAPLPGEVA